MLARIVAAVVGQALHRPDAAAQRPRAGRGHEDPGAVVRHGDERGPVPAQPLHRRRWRRAASARVQLARPVEARLTNSPFRGRRPQRVAAQHRAGDDVAGQRRGVHALGHRARDLVPVPQRDAVVRADQQRVPHRPQHAHHAGGQPVELAHQVPLRAVGAQPAHARVLRADPQPARAVEREGGERVAGEPAGLARDDLEGAGRARGKRCSAASRRRAPDRVAADEQVGVLLGPLVGRPRARWSRGGRGRHGARGGGQQEERQEQDRPEITHGSLDAAEEGQEAQAPHQAGGLPDDVPAHLRHAGAAVREHDGDLADPHPPLPALEAHLDLEARSRRTVTRSSRTASSARRRKHLNPPVRVVHRQAGHDAGVEVGRVREDEPVEWPVDHRDLAVEVARAQHQVGLPRRLEEAGDDRRVVREVGVHLEHVLGAVLEGVAEAVPVGRAQPHLARALEQVDARLARHAPPARCRRCRRASRRPRPARPPARAARAAAAASRRCSRTRCRSG